ncbi:hypothetical protein OEZ85_002973 [Tetradesmus obliquus]|uniref:Protein ENHANCED DISEASE RESISTANCE 2 C-terminal domain-containing protein n=1 Tax=Tetradesmus obliquus TaxID=3088 RepID=A0ABY8U466_TETOB|nr:hypothetical protein OEZ85_002973 [Tetradesmus obliquus]
MAAAAAGATLDRNAALNPLDAAEVPHPMSKRWVPYKHSSGMAIYLHQNITQGDDFVGGEFMVSSTVRGSPQQCLAALTHSSSSTSILGPAAAVQVLSRNGDAQVLHLQLPPPVCSSLCSSLCSSHAWLGPEPQHSSSSSGSGSGGSSGSGSLCLGAQLWRPVLLDVAGGYTISGLGGCEDDASPESLVTCILKVDLGGWLSQQGPAGWLYSPALALGVVEALLEQLLGSVGLVKAEVEAQRFASYSPAVPEEALVGLDGGGQQLTGLCNRAVWSELHAPGTPSLFKVRGPNYLADRGKVPAGQRAYCLLAVDLVTTPTAVQHVARFLPSVRRCRAASCFVFNMMVPAADSVLNLVMTFGSSSHWQQLAVASRSSSSSTGSADTGTGINGGSDAGSSSGSWASGSGIRACTCSSSSSSSSSSGSGIRACTCSSSSSSSGACQWSGLDHVLYRFIHASDTERSSILKMIPHIEVGSWVVKQAVGTTPFIVGRKLATTYHLTDRYMEVDIDVTTCKTAGYIVQSIRGVTTSMVVDLAFLLEGQRPAELPEQLMGAVRFTHLDMAAAVPLDISREVPPWPQPWEQLQS